MAQATGGSRAMSALAAVEAASAWAARWRCRLPSASLRAQWPRHAHWMVTTLRPPPRRRVEPWRAAQRPSCRTATANFHTRQVAKQRASSCRARLDRTDAPRSNAWIMVADLPHEQRERERERERGERGLENKTMKKKARLTSRPCIRKCTEQGWLQPITGARQHARTPHVDSAPASLGGWGCARTWARGSPPSTSESASPASEAPCITRDNIHGFGDYIKRRLTMIARHLLEWTPTRLRRSSGSLPRSTFGGAR